MTDLPLFPLGTVLFPGGLLPLRVFEQRYLELVKSSMREQSPFGVCLIREGAEVGAPATPEPVGCLAHIVQWDMQQLGLLRIAARGAERFRIIERRLQDAAGAHQRGTAVGMPDSASAERLAGCRRRWNASPPNTASASSPSRSAESSLGGRPASAAAARRGGQQLLAGLDGVPRLEATAPDRDRGTKQT